MDAHARKKVGIITKYAVQNFGSGDWYTLGQITGHLATIQEHPRLLRSLGFGDDDYDGCAAQVLNDVFEEAPEAIDTVVDHFDVDVWYRQVSPEKHGRVFSPSGQPPKFWKPGYLSLFFSHLAANREKLSYLKQALETWGVSSFLAHEDIEPSLEWQAEIEAGLRTMDVLVAVVEPGFSESKWTDQEVGYALGRDVDVIPVRVGADPYGFIGKIQGIQAKKKLPSTVADELVLVILKKPRYRRKLLDGMQRAFPTLGSEVRQEKIEQLYAWSLATEEELRTLIEATVAAPEEKEALATIIEKVGAFKPADDEEDLFEDIPF